MMHLRLLTTTIGLFALLGLTYASSFAPLGIGNFIVSTLIAMAKGALIVAVFMHLGEKALSRTILMTGLLCLLVLYSLTVGEIWTRPDVSAPSGFGVSGR